MDDFFSEIVGTLTIAAITAVIITLLFRLFYGSFKRRQETKEILHEKRVYLPVYMGSFILVAWLNYTLFHMGSAATAFMGTLILLTAMVPIIKFYVRTTWQSSIFIFYSFIVVNVLGFFPIFAVLAGVGLR